MTGQLRAEARKLLTVRSTLLVAAATIVVEVLFKLLLAALSDISALDARGQFDLLAPTLFLPLGAALLGLLAASAEWRFGLAIPTYLARPRRAGVLLAKAGVALAAGLLVGLVAAAAADLSMVAVFERRTGGAPAGSDVTVAILGTTAACGLLAVAGVAVGTLVVNQPAAIILVAAVLLVLGPLALVLSPEIAARLPTGTIEALAGQGALDPDALGVLPGGALLAVYALALNGAAALVLARREITT